MISQTSTAPNISLALPDAMKLGESPLWCDRTQTLWWVDIHGCAIHRLHGALHTVYPTQQEPGCIALTEDDAMLMVAMRDGFYQFNLTTQTFTQIWQADFDTKTTRFNDGKVDHFGRFWAGTMYEPRSHAAAALYCLDRGRVSRVAGEVTVSNGLAFDAQYCYHADTPAHVVYRYPLDSQGHLGARQVWLRFSDVKDSTYQGRPDGATMDADGNYWIAMYEGGRVLQFSPQGALLQTIVLPAYTTTMPCFGGADLRTLFITSATLNEAQQGFAASHPHSNKVLQLSVKAKGQAAQRYRL